MVYKRLLALSFVVAICVSSNIYADIVAHWKLDGNATDSAGSYNGTVYGAQKTTGMVGDALLFDGVNDYVEISSIGNPSGSFTVMAWAKITSESQNAGIYGDNDCIISKHIAFKGYYLEYNWDSNRIQGGLGDGSSWNRINGSAWEIGEWHHLALTYDASSNFLRLFDNGVKQGTIAVNSPRYTTFDLRIGNSEGFSNQYFRGIIDYVQIHDRILRVDEIRAVVPEPATLSFFAIGALAFIAKKKKR